MSEAKIRELEDELELMRQKLTALTGSSKELGVLMGVGCGMTARLATMLLILTHRAPAVISRSTFHSLVYGDRIDGGPEPKIFAVHISRLRALLIRIKAPGKIETIWNAGYRASPELVKWTKTLYVQQIIKE